jgi:hypothetical protein
MENEYIVPKGDYEMEAIVSLAACLGYDCYQHIIGGKRLIKIQGSWISFEKKKEVEPESPTS